MRARERERVRGLVQHGGEDVVGAAREAFAGDQQLVDERVRPPARLPAVGCEVTEQQAAARGLSLGRR